MKYIEINPRPELSPYINCFWVIQVMDNTSFSDRVFPDGSIEIIFNPFRNVFRKSGGHPTNLNPSAELIGQLTLPYEIDLQGNCTIVGVRFFPHTFNLFLGQDLSEYNNLNPPLHIVSRLLSSISEEVINLTGEGNTSKAIDRVETFLLRLLTVRTQSSSEHLLNYAVNYILKNKDKSNIDALVRSTGVSHRYLQRVFKHSGISAKHLLKFFDFKKHFNPFLVSHRFRKRRSVAAILISHISSGTLSFFPE